MKDLSEFSKVVVNTLSKRAGQVCSNPSCRRHTSGGHTEDSKAVIVGEATHIYGKKLDSARYDPQMTDQERADTSNGIWFCGNCHKMIDSDEIKFPARLLLKWKYEHESSVLGGKGQNSDNRIVQALLNELKENSIVTKNVLEKGNYSVKMSNESWNTYKGDFGFMTEELQSSLIEIYNLISNFNGLIDYNMYKLSHGAGYVDDKIRGAAEAFGNSAISVIDELEKLKAP